MVNLTSGQTATTLKADAERVTKHNAGAADHAARAIAEVAVFARAACFNRVAQSASGITDAACAALVNIDLHLARAVLTGLVATGDCEKVGQLYRVATPRRAA